MKEKIIFIGDSITEGFSVEKHLSEFDISNFGISGLASYEVLNYASDVWFKENPDYIFICIGTNDFARNVSDEEVLQNIKIISNYCIKKTPSSKIILIPVFPTKNNQPRPNSRIVKFNYKLKKLAGENNFNFFNLHPHFTDEAGQLRSEFTDDGLHLTEAAYKKWAEEFKKYYLEELKNED
ncbi:MAG: hypothetical protein HND52_16785 [Ignavibacteriae bacterium]|nr:hypothetical protein [Ignavibacteriota bacterium]NOG99616.1 hypothetical protein [Ignavibacteriota bacterium]